MWFVRTLRCGCAASGNGASWQTLPEEAGDHVSSIATELDGCLIIWIVRRQVLRDLVQSPQRLLLLQMIEPVAVSVPPSNGPGYAEDRVELHLAAAALTLII